MMPAGRWLPIVALSLATLGCKRPESGASSGGEASPPAAATSAAASDAPEQPVVEARAGDAPLATVRAFRNAVILSDRNRAVGYFLHRDRELGRQFVERYDPELARRPLTLLSTRSGPSRVELDVSEGSERLTYFLELEDGLWRLDQAAARAAAFESLRAHLRDAGRSDADVELGLELARRLSRLDAGVDARR